MGDIPLRLLWLSEHQVVQTAPLFPLSHHHYNHKDCHLHDSGADGHLVARLSPRLVISGKYSSSRSSCLKPGRVEKRTAFQDSLIFRVEKRPFWRVGGVDLFFSFSIERMEHLFSTLWQGRLHWEGVCELLKETQEHVVNKWWKGSINWLFWGAWDIMGIRSGMKSLDWTRKGRKYLLTENVSKT